MIKVSLAAIVIILAIAGYFFFPYLQEKISEKSTASIYIKSDRIYFDFKIAKKDQISAQDFLDNLGAEKSLLQGISLELDQNSINELSKILPANLIINFSRSKIVFKERQRIHLKSFISHQRYEFATDSAKSVFILGNDRDFSLDIENPKPLFDYATSSGKLHLSKKSEQLFPILSKIAKIELQVNGENVEGSIILKD